MELKEFVTEALTSIIGGVRDAQKTDVGKYVNPKWGSAGPGSKHAYVTEDEQLARIVQFDVAVTTTDASQGNAGAKISVLSIGIGGAMSSSSENSTVSKIAFNVPISLPVAGTDVEN